MSVRMSLTSKHFCENCFLIQRLKRVMLKLQCEFNFFRFLKKRNILVLASAFFEINYFLLTFLPIANRIAGMLVGIFYLA